MRAVQTGPGSCDEGESRRDGIAVHDESWYLGDGGFAERHLEDEGRVAAKKVGSCALVAVLRYWTVMVCVFTFVLTFVFRLCRCRLYGFA